MDRATTAVLARLRLSRASTVTLQAELYATHVAKQIYDLRAKGYLITMTRTSNGTALYELVSEPDAPVEAGRRSVGSTANPSTVGLSTPPASTGAPRTVPQFGDVQAIRAIRQVGR